VQFETLLEGGRASSFGSTLGPDAPAGESAVRGNGLRYHCRLCLCLIVGQRRAGVMHDIWLMVAPKTAVLVSLLVLVALLQRQAAFCTDLYKRLFKLPKGPLIAPTQLQCRQQQLAYQQHQQLRRSAVRRSGGKTAIVSAAAPQRCCLHCRLCLATACTVLCVPLA
jgi:hypothetical protein